MLVEDFESLQGLIVLLDDGDLLVLEIDLMSTHDVQEGHACLAAQKFVILLLLKDIEKPDDGIRVDDILLERGLIPDVELDDLQDLQQGIVVFRVHQSVEHVDVVLLIQAVFLSFLSDIRFEIAYICVFLLVDDEVEHILSCFLNYLLGGLFGYLEEPKQSGEVFFDPFDMMSLLEVFQAIAHSIQDILVVLPGDLTFREFDVSLDLEHHTFCRCTVGGKCAQS